MASSDFSLVAGQFAYRNREDKTLLKPNYLVEGSQNVVTNTSNRLQLVRGYTLDGSASTVNEPVSASFDWDRTAGDQRNLRGYYDTGTSKGVLQYRYVDSLGVVTWRDLITTLNSGIIRFADYWDATALISKLLFVDGSSNIYEWSGGLTSYASSTVNTLTKQGVQTWDELGFTATGKVTINGTVYTYTGGYGTTTLTGVTPDPTGAGIAAGAIVNQAVVTTANSTITALPAAFKNSIIGILRNQVYIGASDVWSIYVSKVNNYKDFSVTTPTRVMGEGSLVTLDGIPTAFAPQEDKMYISSGKHSWFNTKFTLSSDNTKEEFEIVKLKTASLQGALSQEFVTKNKNNVIFVSNEPVLTTIGLVENIFQTPQMTDHSYSIVNDFNEYDFTDGSVVYHRNFIYVAVPKESLIRIYNQTDANNMYWEAPVTYPISRFSVIDGELYGHSYYSVESYKLFDGYNFNGQPIPAIAKFAYNNYGTRSNSKGFNEVYIEGYISQNTVLDVTSMKELDGCATTATKTINGLDKTIVCIGGDDASLGKQSLGKNPLGGTLKTKKSYDLPPKFRVVQTFPVNPYFYECQMQFESSGVDYQWEIIAFGVKLTPISDLNTKIKQ